LLVVNYINENGTGPIPSPARGEGESCVVGSDTFPLVAD
jgi:hypothetical protein